MKRDWELVRKILLQVEQLGTPDSHLEAADVDGHAAEVVSYHLRIIGEAGLLKVRCHQGISGSETCAALSLTWDGHEFLDRIRTHTVWNRVKGLVRDKGLELSIDAIKLAASAIMEGLLKS